VTRDPIADAAASGAREPRRNREYGVKDALLGVPVKLTKEGAVCTYEIELSASEKEAFGKAVAANVELMNIARGLLG
jgi:malate/lactate dehydrogenase